HREDLDRGGGAVLAGGIRQSVAEGVVQPVDLVGVDPRLGAEDVAVIEIGLVEHPMLRPVDGEAALAARGEAAPGGIEAAEAIHPEGAGARPVDRRILPAGGPALVVPGAAHGILGGGAELVADLPAALILEPAL